MMPDKIGKVFEALGYEVKSHAGGIVVATRDSRYLIFKQLTGSLEIHFEVDQEGVFGRIFKPTTFEVRVLPIEQANPWVTIKTTWAHEGDVRELAPILDQLGRAIATPIP